MMEDCRLGGNYRPVWIGRASQDVLESKHFFFFFFCFVLGGCVGVGVKLV